MMRGPLSSSALEETLRSCKNHPSVFDSSDMLRLMQAAERARYGGVMEITEALRMLVETVISQNVKENLLLIQLRDLENGVLRLRGAVCRLKNGSTYEVSLRYENITRTYLTNVGGHFKEIDLKDELCRYKATGRAKKSVSATVIDFYDIFSNSFVLTQAISGHMLFWLSLGACDEIREEKFKSLMEAKATFTVDSRVAMAEALEDLRSYRFFNGALIPPKKNGKIEIGLGRSDKKRMSAEEWIAAVGNGTDEC